MAQVRSIVEDRRSVVYTERMKRIGELVQISQLLGKKLIPEKDGEKEAEAEAEAGAEAGAETGALAGGADAVDVPAEAAEAAVQEVEIPPADLGGPADLAPGTA